MDFFRLMILPSKPRPVEYSQSVVSSLTRHRQLILHWCRLIVVSFADKSDFRICRRRHLLLRRRSFAGVPFRPVHSSQNTTERLFADGSDGLSSEFQGWVSCTASLLLLGRMARYDFRISFPPAALWDGTCTDVGLVMGGFLTILLQKFVCSYLKLMEWFAQFFTFFWRLLSHSAKYVVSN